VCCGIGSVAVHLTVTASISCSKRLLREAFSVLGLLMQPCSLFCLQCTCDTHELPHHLPPVRCALLCTVLGAERSQQAKAPPTMQWLQVLVQELQSSRTVLYCFFLFAQTSTVRQHCSCLRNNNKEQHQHRKKASAHTQESCH
jgi:hypothetical protein